MDIIRNFCTEYIDDDNKSQSTFSKIRKKYCRYPDAKRNVQNFWIDILALILIYVVEQFTSSKLLRGIGEISIKRMLVFTQLHKI
jgi:hypothetical protein